MSTLHDSAQQITCDGCSACCMEQTTPPGYYVILMTGAWPPGDDWGRFERLPIEAKLAIADADIDSVGPCCWLDVESKRCRWYEWRPQICRDFKVGSESCLSWRCER